MSAEFVHLHTHTMYSLLDGAIKLKDYVRTVKEWGCGAAAITDHGNMFGAVEYYLMAKKEGINPIIGSEVYVAIDGMGVKRAARGNNDGANHFVLLASSTQGYRNLMKIVSAGYLDGFYYHPRVDKDILREYSEGLIGMSACIGGEIPQLIIQGHEDEARAAAEEYQRIFGEGNFYLELQDHGIPEEKIAREGLVDLSKQVGIPLVATNDAHYLKAEHADSHEVLLCISTGKTLEDAKRMRMETRDLYLKSPEEMHELFADYPEALANTVEIANRCDVEIQTGIYHPVRFQIPTDFEGNADAYLAHITEEGMRERYGDQAEEFRERMEYELGIIKEMGFSDYFLAIYDCTRAAREMGVPVGTARGSAGGSIVAYAIGITNLEPMQFGLIFERFLNPERVSMPDFDVDYADRDRSRMIDYVREKYGDDHVSLIITFGSMKSRLVIRDVGRVLNMPYGDVDKIAKLIPAEPKMTVEKALDIVPELGEMMNSDPKVAELFRHAQVLEGLSRHAGTHAAGVIITPGPSTEYLPLYKQGDDITSQYTMEYVEKIGCLKVDFLGLRTLSVIKDAVDMANDTGAGIDIDHIPLDDQPVYDLMGRGETVAIFQFESGGMRDYLRKLKPTCIEDLIAMNALYRPGPLGSNMVDDFIDRKHGRKDIAYPHPLLESILKETYGVIVYQEQVMKIANVMAGFTLGGADELRRAMGKKKVEVMAEMRLRFIDGAKKKNIPESKSGEVFDLMAHFAGYGFNKSHSAGYAILAYQTAWLKAHYPSELMAATFSSEMDSTDRIVVFIEECRRMGIEVLPPDINSSFAHFTVEDGNVRFGLGAIKNVGLGGIEAIVEARKEGGKFSDLFEFCERVEMKSLNRRMLESLIMAGAMDCFGVERSTLMVGIDLAIENAQHRQREREMGQTSLFGEAMDNGIMEKPELPPVTPWTRMERLAKEKSVLGFWFSGHPLEGYVDEIRAFTTPFSRLFTHPEGDKVTVGGVVTAVTRKTSKKSNKPFMILRIEDLEGSGEALLFNGVYESYKDEVEVDSLVLVEGAISSNSEDEPSIFTDTITSLDEARKTRTKAVNISLSTLEADDKLLDDVTGVCKRHPGELALNIKLQTQTGTFRVKSKKYRVTSDGAFMKEMRSLLGKERVWIQ